MTTIDCQQHNNERLQAVSAFLKEYRIGNGYSQIEISDSANLSRNTIVRMESSCHENITLLTIFKIADAMDLDVNQIFQEIE